MFKLTKGYYIRALDRQNWIIAKMIKGKSKKGEAIETESVWGCWGMLSQVWRGAVDLLALESKDYPDLTKTIERLEELRKDLIKNGKVL